MTMRWNFSLLSVEVSKHSWILWMMTCHSIWHTQKARDRRFNFLTLDKLRKRTRSHHGHEKLQPILKKRTYLWTMWWEMSKLTNLQIVRIGNRTFQTYSYKLLEVGTIVTCKFFLQCLHFLFEQEPISRKTLQARVPCAYRAPIGWVIEGFQETSHNQQTALQWNNWHSVQWKHRNRLYTMTTRKRVIGNLISHMYSCLIYRYIISYIYVYMRIYV